MTEDPNHTLMPGTARYPSLAGDLHVHLFGCPVLSFAHGMRAQAGDGFEIDVPAFGRPLRNTLAADPQADRFVEVGVL